MKKTLAFALAAILSLGMLSGCGKQETTNEEAEAPAKEQLIMGTNAEFPPFEFVADSGEGIVGEYDGIDIAISKRIAESLGKELKVENMQFEGLIASVQSGKVDFAIAGMTVTEERKQSVAFSDTYFVAEQVIVVAPDNADITCAADLKNDKTVGVVLGYTGDAIVTDDLQIPEEKVLRVSRGIDAVQEVKNGKLDAVVIDSATGIALAKENGLKIVEDKEAFAAEEYAIAINKDNTELVEAINKVLAEMKENGEIDELAVKYNG
ncbi:MAG: transporter substrate-binding domain-containing protein [Ruminococcaceae bacterium]|nr:transporter substrate-binding domain-containing protein [Oscillospiraceae bacterium]